MTSVNASDNNMAAQPADNAYDFTFHTLAGHHPLPLSTFKGKVLLVVNTASKCGFTPQYAGLEKLYLEYKDRGLVVLGVPSNDFGSQEPGSDQDIASFCQINYGVTFPMTSKEVVSGKNATPFYLWARKKAGFGSAPKWNFHKYLIGRNGELISYYYSTTSPDSPRLKRAIEKALSE
ncbi:glutathione peroxidase [Legionella sp. CNM-4043-24]|uniref:glutathione peroxidase n=1 Tax=Legionella sp. CNM-4043-24 TaxID=3421646 RepID=UPI00403AD3D7